MAACSFRIILHRSEYTYINTHILWNPFQQRMLHTNVFMAEKEAKRRDKPMVRLSIAKWIYSFFSWHCFPKFVSIASCWRNNSSIHLSPSLKHTHSLTLFRLSKLNTSLVGKVILRHEYETLCVYIRYLVFETFFEKQTKTDVLRQIDLPKSKEFCIMNVPYWCTPSPFLSPHMQTIASRIGWKVHTKNSKGSPKQRAEWV